MTTLIIYPTNSFNDITKIVDCKQKTHLNTRRTVSMDTFFASSSPLG